MPPSDDLRAERQRRKNFTADVLALFESRPNEWIDASELAKVGGSLAWRTRVADARRIVAKDGGTIENRQQRLVACGGERRPVISKYRYLTNAPLGRPADVPIPDRWPVSEAPTQEPWTLKP